MSLDKRHFLPNKKDREYKYFHPIYKMGSKSLKEYERVEDVLDVVTCDVINGVAKSDILLKLEAGLYENQTKGLSHLNALEYYKAVLSRLQIDEPEKDNARQVFYSMYLNLYREQMEAGNTIAAKQTLDSMVKLMGLTDKPTTAVQVNAGEKDKNITINFGFDGEH